jgi:hypothetical protein
MINMASRSNQVINILARLEGRRLATFWMVNRTDTVFHLTGLNPDAQHNYDIMLDSFITNKSGMRFGKSNILAVPASPGSLDDILPHYNKYDTNLQQFTDILRQVEQKYYDNKTGNVKADLMDLLKARQQDIKPCISQQDSLQDYHKNVAELERDILTADIPLDSKIKRWADTVIYSEKYYKYDPTRVEKSLARLESLLSANNGLELELLKTFLPAEHPLLAMTLDNIRESVLAYVKAYPPSNKFRQALLGFEPSCEEFVNIDYLYNTYNFAEEGACFAPFTQEYNNFYIYLESHKSSIFPIRFILPKDMDIFYTNGLYHFKRTKPLDTIFKYTYCGAIIIRSPYPERYGKYAYRYVFVFKDGYRYKLTDIFMNRITKLGSLLPAPNVTHVEFSQLINYMDMVPYRIRKDILDRYLTKQSSSINYEDTLFFTRQKSIPDHLRALLEPADIIVTDAYAKSLSSYGQGRIYSLKKNNKQMLSGGGKTSKVVMSKYKMLLGSKLTLVDKCAGQLFKTFDDARVNIQATHGFKSIVNITGYLYPYIFSNEAKFIFTNLEQPNMNYKSILKYIPLTSQFFSYNELYTLYLKDRRISSAIYFGQNPAILEVLFYNRYTLDTAIFVNNSPVPYPTAQIYNYKSLLFTDKYELPFGEYEPQYLCAYSLLDLFVPGFNLNYAFQNDINLFIGMLCGLKYTQHGGIFVLNIAHIINKNQADVYLILKRHFQESHLYYPEISNPAKHSGAIAVFIGYKGIPDQEYQELLSLLNKIRTAYPNGASDLNILDAKTRKRCLVSKPITNPTPIYIYGYLNTKLTDDAYQEIIQFNNYRYGRQYLFLNKLEYLITNPGKKPKQLPTQDQIQESLLYLKKWEIPHFDFGPINKKLSAEFYMLIKPLKFEFTKYKEHDNLYEFFSNKRNTGSTSLIQQLEPYNNLIHQTGLYIDSRRDFTITDTKAQTHAYDAVKTQFRFFTPDFQEGKLARLLETKYNIENISQAWIKMWEMLTDCAIVQPGITHYNSFHLCEAPGMFIMALNHYLHTKTNVKKFNWNAQSLHPAIARIKDTYSLIEKYPANWHWGPSQTGDVRDIRNINYYRKFTSNVQLITSDCGLEWGNPDYEHVALASLSALMSLAPLGSTIIFKTLAPSDNPLLLDLFYMVYMSFEQLIFYKPLQNLYSREYYIIGKKCAGISASHKTVLDRIIQGLPVTKIYDSYIADFTVQMEAFMDLFSSNYSYTIEKQIWYMDNIKTLSPEFKSMARQSIIDKNNDWLKLYKVVRLPRQLAL